MLEIGQTGNLFRTASALEVILNILQQMQEQYRSQRKTMLTQTLEQHPNVGNPLEDCECLRSSRELRMPQILQREVSQMARVAEWPRVSPRLGIV